MTALSTRDALAKALCADRYDCGETWDEPVGCDHGFGYRDAGLLIASGAVVDVATLAALIAATRDLDYDPSQEAWICGAHGVAECDQADCPDLPWPEPNADPLLGAFTDWADAEFRRVVRPYDEGHVPEMPEEAFRSYSVSEWPLDAVLAALTERAS